jgi:fumarylacetoacetase
VSIARDATHDPALRSWVTSANAPGTDFPVQNLPFGVFRRRASGELPRVGIAIGDRILDVSMTVGHGLVSGAALAAARACEDESLNALMAMGADAVRALRHAVSALLRVGGDGERHARELLVPMDAVELLLPVHVGDYTDFYASIYHASNVGAMLRPENPLLPNYKYVPIGYHGRASSIVVSGHAVRRPCGQTRDDAAQAPCVGPSRRLDYEIEVGAYIGEGNPLGQPIAAATAERHVFGLCLLNDWSARDMQTWEYQPLGPFLAKSFVTTVSPWVVTLDALAPFRVPAFTRPEGDPAPLPYLTAPGAEATGGFDITLEVLLETARMRAHGDAPVRVSRGTFRDMYWTIAQLVTHHASNGCNLRPGDLLASGTVSGPTAESRGCLLERTARGSAPLALPNGEARAFLEDGDAVVLRGFCEREGQPRIGFGECRGIVIPALPG